MKRVVCVGGAVLDRVLMVGALPRGGGKTFAAGRRDSGGGIAATAACAVAALGGRAAWIGPVGDDAAGQDLLDRMRAWGVDVSGAQLAPGVATPVAIALVDPEGERQLIVHRDAGLDLAEVPLPPCDAVMVDHRHPGASAAALREARARGVPAVLDVDTGVPEGVAGLVDAAGHAVFARAALAAHTGHDDPVRGLSAVARPGAVAGVTLGEDGSLFLLDGVLLRIGAPRVQARDTTGCGDVFHGAYALALAEGHDVAGSARFAAAAAALKAQAGQGWDGLPGRAAVETAMRGNW